MSQFRILIDKYLDMLYGAAYGMTGNREDAEDLVQDTCIKAYKNIEQLQAWKNGKSWLYRILTNTFINKYRKKIRSPILHEVDVEQVFDNYLSEYKKSFDISLRSDPLKITDELVNKLFSELHVDIRTIIWLSDVEGFTQKEISEMMDCPLGTVSSRLFRGRNYLKEKLLKYASGYSGKEGTGQ